MRSMFAGQLSFNSPISSWDTARVTSMNSMFMGATTFNSPISSWNTARVTDMSTMFTFASSFNCPISSWNTAKVSLMFYGATNFHQALCWSTASLLYAASIFVGNQGSFSEFPSCMHISDAPTSKPMTGTPTSKPTSGVMNVTSSPVAKVGSPSSKPLTSPSLAPNLNTPCNDNPVASYSLSSGSTKSCSQLATKSFKRRFHVCRPLVSNAASICPDTCSGFRANLSCRDNPNAVFETETSKHHKRNLSCFKLAMISAGERAYICLFTAEASKTCPATCSGRC